MHEEPPLAALQRLSAYRRGREHVFPSDGTLEWFTRTQRAKLLQCGALVKVGGLWFVNAPKFDAYVMSGGRLDELEARSEAAA